MRVFISLEIPEHIRARIFHEIGILKQQGLVSGKFVEKDNLHLTLKFLGDLTEEQITSIEKKLSEIKFNKINCSLSNFGIFPNREYIKVLWIGLKPEKNFENLFSVVDEKLSEIGFSKDDKKFIPHITLARVKQIKDKDLFLNKFENLKIPSEKILLTKISLIKSELYPKGSVYKVIKSFYLR
jgi:RNA 2',3'-cyclic 3'-phosphodiesterase